MLDAYTDNDKARESLAKERIRDILLSLVKKLIKRGISPDEIQRCLEENLNKADDEGEWSVKITRFQ